MDRQDDVISRLADLQGGQGEIRATLHHRGERLASLESGQADLRATLGRLEPMIVKILEGQAILVERVAHMPNPAEFYELRGRVEEISRRLPTTLAYAPSPGRKEPSAG